MILYTRHLVRVLKNVGSRGWIETDAFVLLALDSFWKQLFVLNASSAS